MIERFIDYVQFTAQFNEADFPHGEFETIRGIQYYPRGYRDASGTRFYFGANKGAPCFCILAGEQMQYFRDVGAGDVGVLDWAFQHDAKISRLDLAVTEYIEENLFLPEDVEKWFKDGSITSSHCAGGCKKIADVRQGKNDVLETLYIGDIKKRAKRGIFRAYDKGVDLGIGNEMISRIELELKREKAHVVAKRIASKYDISGNFRTYFDVNNQEFERIMQSPVVEAVRGKGKPKTERSIENDKRWQWLIEQVAPALKEAIRLDYDMDLGNNRMFQFMAASGITKDASEFADKLAEYRMQNIKFERVKLLED